MPTRLPRDLLCARPIYEGNEISCLQIEVLNTELRCPICLNILRDPVATECMHRFCAGCIEKCLRVGKKECPTCRKPVATKRNLRKDTNFQDLITKLYPASTPEVDGNQMTPMSQKTFNELNNAGADMRASPDPWLRLVKRQHAVQTAAYQRIITTANKATAVKGNAMKKGMKAAAMKGKKKFGPMKKAMKAAKKAMK